MMAIATKVFAALLVILCIDENYGHVKRSLDLIAAHSLISDNRLPLEITPNNYKLKIRPVHSEEFFKGQVFINMTWQEPTDKITLHAHQDLEIFDSEISVIQYAADDETDKSTSAPFPLTAIKIVKTERVPKKPLYVIHLEKTLKRGSQCEVSISFKGRLFNETSEGLFRHVYKDAITGVKKWFIATHLRPNLARTVFPCFDEPSYKVPFTVSIARPRNMTSVSNMPLAYTERLPNEPDFAWDHFRESPPMSTFTLALIVCEFSYIDYNKTENSKNIGKLIRIWGRPEYLVSLQNVTKRVADSIVLLREFWGTPYVLPKVDCFALPVYYATKPGDNWGLLFFKESELIGKKVSYIAQEVVYQWLGILATPFWWSDAHINNALNRYLTAYTTLKLSSDQETFNNWPMTMLYSIYYEFSKRYPHGKTTAIKQDSVSAKTELLFRMLNYTLGESTFKHGLQKFMTDRQYKTFFADDIWASLTEQARFDNVLDKDISVNEIAASWITKDRLPVVTVDRIYGKNAAILTQKVYLRERPHDVPDQDKFWWWIPIVLVKQNKLNFSDTKPIVWMQNKEIRLENMPDADKFIIVNPEEIGPFPVNYDTENWNMLAKFLQDNDNRKKIPVNTRAKLLHDAWNLAYAGDLCFNVALNMTLFLKDEREYLAWDPVFTMIDHIGRHIDSSEVHKKFQTYIRILLTPLYQELGSEPQEGESEGTAHLRSSTKVFLCQAGYKPCVEEAQAAYRRWMNSDNPDEGNPVANQYICPVFKWGTKEEWEFGLQRVLNFPASRKTSERTYLLKTLAGCPVDSWKIEKLLNITVLEENNNFTDNDVYLIFSMMTGGASGYTTLFNFLEKNWDMIKVKFDKKPHLWNSLVTSATTVFKTQEGLDMVSELYVERQGEFGTAEFVVEKALKNIKEETKWSDENLPVIEAWLDDYLKANNAINLQDSDLMRQLWALITLE